MAELPRCWRVGLTDPSPDLGPGEASPTSGNPLVEAAQDPGLPANSGAGLLPRAASNPSCYCRCLPYSHWRRGAEGAQVLGNLLVLLPREAEDPCHFHFRGEVEEDSSSLDFPHYFRSSDLHLTRGAELAGT